MLVMTTFISTLPFDLVREAERESIATGRAGEMGGGEGRGGKYTYLLVLQHNSLPWRGI